MIENASVDFTNESLREEDLATKRERQDAVDKVDDRLRQWLTESNIRLVSMSDIARKEAEWNAANDDVEKANGVKKNAQTRRSKSPSPKLSHGKVRKTNASKKRKSMDVAVHDSASRKRGCTRKLKGRDVLVDYFLRHGPSPSQSTKQSLANEAGLSIRQVNYWFGNARRRHRGS